MLADLRVDGEGLHGAQQLSYGGAEQRHRQSLRQVLSGQIEHARCGHQVHVGGRGVALHHTQHQLEWGRNHEWNGTQKLNEKSHFEAERRKTWHMLFGYVTDDQCCFDYCRKGIKLLTAV